MLQAGQAVLDSGIDQVGVDERAAGRGHAGAVDIDRLGVISDHQPSITTIADQDIGTTAEQKIVDFQVACDTHSGRQRFRGVGLAIEGRGPADLKARARCEWHVALERAAQTLGQAALLRACGSAGFSHDVR